MATSATAGMSSSGGAHSHPYEPFATSRSSPTNDRRHRAPLTPSNWTAAKLVRSAAFAIGTLMSLMTLFIGLLSVNLVYSYAIGVEDVASEFGESNILALTVGIAGLAFMLLGPIAFYVIWVVWKEECQKAQKNQDIELGMLRRSQL